MDDDLFQSLGGSLMKDLLADLQGDDTEGDGWLSLEQLEKELSQLDNNEPPPPPQVQMPLPSAASMVVTGQQQQQQQQQQQPIQGVGLLGAVTVTKQAPADAWKESLQKFTALSLDQDFLAADTVRKQHQAHQPAAQLPPGFLDQAQDYDEQEQASIAMKPPPGINKEQELAASLASALQGKQPPSIPERKSMPKTPVNSMALTETTTTTTTSTTTTKTPRNSVVVTSSTQAAAIVKEVEEEDDIPMMPKVDLQQQPQQMPTKTPRNSMVVPNQQGRGQMPQGQMPPPHMMQPGMPPPHMMPMGMPPHPHMMQQMQMQQMMHHMQGGRGMPPQMQGPPPPHMQPGPGMPPPHMQGMMVPPPGGVPVAMQMPQGPAWQQRPPPPQQQQPPQPQGPPPRQLRVFCNPHPNAPPIPAQALESDLMKSRDISYIIHSILKPILMAGFSEYDYDIQLLYRQSGARPAGPRPVLFRGKPPQPPNKKVERKKSGEDGKEMEDEDDVVQQEMASREAKSKEWSSKNAALGHLPKANVARPRALIASPVMASSSSAKDADSKSEQKQRAKLWKSRIYCDQAYQAYLQVVDVWAKAPPGSVPPQVQAPLIKLMKCLGMAPDGGIDVIKVDPLVMQLFLKLSKGRNLLARIVEQALLPPSAVQAMLSTCLDILYKTPAPANNANDTTDDRCFRALTSVIQTLPSLTGDSILQCAEVMKANAEAALSTTNRMECLHALLQRGTSMASTPEAAAFATPWKETESSFMAILSGM